MAIRKGSRVRSKRVGSRTQFVGVVTERLINPKREVYFHVADKDGVLWLRTMQELKHVTPEVTCQSRGAGATLISWR